MGCCCSQTLEGKGVRDAGYRVIDESHSIITCTTSWVTYNIPVAKLLVEPKLDGNCAGLIGTTPYRNFCSTYIISLCLLIFGLN